MNKLAHILYFFLIIQCPSLWAQLQSECHVDGKSLEVINSTESKSIEMLKNSLMLSACNSNSIFSDVKDPEFIINHNEVRCGEIEVCSAGGEHSAASLKDASEVLKDVTSKAALLSALTSEVTKNSEYNILLNQYEEANKTSLCPSEKIETECDGDIRKVLGAAGGSLVGFPDLDRGPIALEVLPKFVSDKLLSKRQFLLKLKVKKTKMSKEQLKANCSKKISFNRICKTSKERLKTIALCEADRSIGCLNQEQSALASLLNVHKSNKDLFLAMEKQLCTKERMVSEDAEGLLNSALRKSGISYSPQILSQSTSFGMMENTNKLEESSDHSPSEANLIHKEALQVVDVPKVQVQSEKHADEIKSFETNDDHLFNEMNSDNLVDNKVMVNNSVADSKAAWSEFSNRFNTITEEEKKKKAEDEAEKKKLEDLSNIEHNSNLSDSDKKSEEMNALLAQINTLKTKLEEMNAKVDELKSKKPADAVEKQEVDKGALEREKAILELKKKLAELEADKKKIQAENSAKAAEAQRNRDRSIEEARKFSSISSISSHSNNSDKIDTGKREREKIGNAFNPTTLGFGESRAPSSVSSSASNSSSGSGLILKSLGAKSTSDSAVVYMTANELQKYPYHLNDNASSVDIEKMILKNNGASIILGDREQIVPIIKNGVIQLDENGKVKYKRIKISLVKNDSERKQNIAREISSVADLKKEEQNQRDLIRYQQMINAIKQATDKK